MASPTPPVLSSPDFIIGNSVAGMSALSTWGRTRAAVINRTWFPEYPGNNIDVGPNSLIIYEGFHPEECHLIRVSEWPSKYEWFDGSAFITAVTGPFCAYQYSPEDENDPPAYPQNSRISIGAIGVEYLGAPSGNSTLDNFLDENDCANFYAVTTVNGFATDSDFCIPLAWLNILNQDLGAVNFNGDASSNLGGFTTFGGMTAF